MEKIEKSCLTILKEMEKGSYTLLELKFMNKFFSEIARVSEEKIKKIEEILRERYKVREEE